MRNRLLILSTLAWFYCGVDCANILAVVPVNSRSHTVVMVPLFKALAARGHHITVVSTSPQTKPLPNYTDIDVSNVFPATGKAFAIDFMKKTFGTVAAQVKIVTAGIGYSTCQAVYADDKITQLFNSTRKFDLVITEIFSTDCFVLFAEKFDAPLISMVTSPCLPWTNDRIGNPDNPSYIVNYFLNYPHQMSLYERVGNTVSLIHSKVLNYFSDSSHLEVVKKYLGGNVPEFHEIYNRRTALIMVNTHYTISQPRPMVPNFIEIGGIHLQQTSPLPKDLQEMLDNADKGFILMSMGTLINMTTMSDHMLKSFLDAFSQFGNLVLWRYDGQLPYYPSNVITRKWLPQKDILAHKNLKIFITHGGMSSILEVVNAGVPIIGIPFYGDQPYNIMNIVRRGAGIHIDYDSITTDVLTTSFNKILLEKSYRENANKLSLQFKDRPQSALDTAIFWTEHVLRHKGASHMRSVTADLPFYKLFMLDVTLLLLLCIILATLLFYKISLFIVRLVKTKKKLTASKTRKKQD